MSDCHHGNTSCSECREEAAERAQKFTDQLRILRDDIIEQATDTLWVGLTETVCERITTILGDDWGKDGDTSSLRSRRAPPQDTNMVVTRDSTAQDKPSPWACSECESATQELKHFAVTPFVAVCGADEPNQTTTTIRAGVTCPACVASNDNVGSFECGCRYDQKSDRWRSCAACTSQDGDK